MGKGFQVHRGRELITWTVHEEQKLNRIKEANKAEFKILNVKMRK